MDASSKGQEVRQRLIKLNNEISLCASRKDLSKAMKLFQQALEDKIANSHTYSAAINAQVRCGSIRGAEEVLNTMLSNGRKKDVIICTTMMKVYLENYTEVFITHFVFSPNRGIVLMAKYTKLLKCLGLC